MVFFGYLQYVFSNKLNYYKISKKVFGLELSYFNNKVNTRTYLM